jgi:hypothetical protein
VSRATRFATVVIAGAAISLLGILLGAWWLAFPVGVAAGVVLPRARWAAPAGALSGFIAWTVPLVYAQVQYGLRAASLSLAAIMGFDGAATIPVALTLVVGLLLGLTGAWLGAAARGLVPGRSPSPGKPVARPATADRVPAALTRR